MTELSTILPKNLNLTLAWLISIFCHYAFQPSLMNIHFNFPSNLQIKKPFDALIFQTLEKIDKLILF